MTPRGNVADTGILNEANKIIEQGQAKDLCEALEKLMEQAKLDGDKEKIEKIKTTQKAKKCRRSRRK